MELNQITKLILEQAKEKGFGTKPEEISVPEKIALIHSEVSEAYESYRKKLSGKDSFENELADIIMRTIHLAGIFDIDLEKHILEKIELNKSRDWKNKNYNEEFIK